MKKILLTLFLGLSLSGFSQTTLIPDAWFEQALIDLGIDLPPLNGSVPTDNISGIKSLYIPYVFGLIEDLTGIEDFTALEVLYCQNNQITSLDMTNNTALIELRCYDNELTSLDVSNNTALVSLRCYDNELTSLDVTNNTALTELRCYDNELTSLDVSNNTLLELLDCYQNQLTSLDVTNNPALIVLACSDNQLTSLDLTNNTALIEFYCHNNQLTSLDARNGNNLNFIVFSAYGNPDLTCIFVDWVNHMVVYFGSHIDPNSTFVANEEECSLVSVAVNIFELGISVYPNPTNNYLFIEGNKNSISFSIYNLLGKKVMSVKNSNRVDVRDLSNGVYTIRISDGVSQTDRKFIKN